MQGDSVLRGGDMKYIDFTVSLVLLLVILLVSLPFAVAEMVKDVWRGR